MKTWFGAHGARGVLARVVPARGALTPVALALAVLAGAGAFSPAHAALVRSFSVGNWQGGAYTSESTGRFSHCAAAATYKNGVGVIFSVDRSYQWRMLFTASHFSLKPGTVMKLGASIDGSAPVSITAHAHDRTTIRIELAPTASLFNRLRAAHQLRLFANDLSHTFNLTGTSSMLPTLLACVKTYA